MVQLFKNLFIFYDKEIEGTLPKGVNIIDYFSNILQNLFPPISRPSKVMKQLQDSIAAIKPKNINTLKTKNSPINENDFVRYFVSEHLIGATQIQIKNLQKGDG